MQTNSASLIRKSDVNIFSNFIIGIKKILVPTQIGINGVLISIKRKNMLKAYSTYSEKSFNDPKKEKYYEKLQKQVVEYLSAVDKYVMDSIYKKVKTDKATEFEKRAMSSYYKISTYKDKEFSEYKCRKQKFLMELDYIRELEKGVLTELHEKFYAEKQTKISRDLLKIYSTRLSDTTELSSNNKLETYIDIFACLAEYVDKVFPIILKYDNEGKYRNIDAEYKKYLKYNVGKLDEKAYLEKNMILLSLSRTLFTHSLPLVIAEMCYEKLLLDTRLLLVNSKMPAKKEKAYTMILMIVEEYNKKILSSKIYWKDKEEKEINKIFWKNYLNAKTDREKEILIVRDEIKKISGIDGKMEKLYNYYKEKLVSYGVMKEISGYSKDKRSFVKIKNKNCEILKEVL